MGFLNSFYSQLLFTHRCLCDPKYIGTWNTYKENEQEDWEFKDSFRYITSSRPAWAVWEPVSKIKIKKKYTNKILIVVSHKEFYFMIIILYACNFIIYCKKTHLYSNEIDYLFSWRIKNLGWILDTADGECCQCFPNWSIFLFYNHQCWET